MYKKSQIIAIVCIISVVFTGKWTIKTFSENVQGFKKGVIFQR